MTSDPEEEMRELSPSMKAASKAAEEFEYDTSTYAKSDYGTRRVVKKDFVIIKKELFDGLYCKIRNGSEEFNTEDGGWNNCLNRIKELADA